MSKYMALTKVLLKGSGDSLVKDGTKRLRKYLLLLLIAAAFTPLAFGIGAAVFGIYDVLKPMGQQGALLALAYSTASLVILLFGLMYVVTVFYFTKDIENLLALPLSSSQILASKFTVTLLYEYLTETVFLAPAIIVYGYKSGAGPLYYIYSFLLFLIIPVIPLITASIVSMFVMRFTNIGKNRDRFKIISGIILMFLVLGFNSAMNSITSSLNSGAQIQMMLLSGNNSMISFITRVTPNARLAALSGVNYNNVQGLLYLILLIIITAAFFMVFLILGEKLYFKGVLGVSESTSKNKKLTSTELDKNTMQGSVLKTYTLKELKLLFRTPIYFMNCILMNFLWPLFITVPILMEKEAVSQFSGLGGLLSDKAYLGIIMASAAAAGMFITTTNAITPTAISREGSNLFFTKYIPVKYEVQLMAKILSGIVMGLVGIISMLIVVLALIRPSAMTVLLLILFSLLGVVFTNFTGIIIDLYFPKLNWDNEQKAVKQNMNVILNMLVSFLAGGGIVFLVIRFQPDYYMSMVLLLTGFLLINFILYRVVMTLGVKLFEKLEG